MIENRWSVLGVFMLLMDPILPDVGVSSLDVARCNDIEPWVEASVASDVDDIVLLY